MGDQETHGRMVFVDEANITSRTRRELSKEPKKRLERVAFFMQMVGA